MPALDLRPLQEGHNLRGIGRYVSTLAAELPYTQAVVWEDLPLPAVATGMHLHPIPGQPAAPGRSAWIKDGVVGRARFGGFDEAVHLPLLDARLATRRSRVVTVHDAIPWRFPEDYPAGRLGRFRQGWDRKVAQAAAVVVTDSHASADDAVRLLGVPEARLHVVRLMAGEPWPAPGSLQARLRPAGLRDGRRYVVAAGGFADLDPRKRLADLVRVLPNLPEDVSVVMTGSLGIHAATLRSLARELGVADRLELTGQLGSDEMVEIFACASAFAFPSAWEGFGLPLLEAMLVGVPSVVSDGGALPEVAGRGATVVPVGDHRAMGEALVDVLGDPVRADGASKAALRRAAEFTSKAFAEAHLQAYAAL